MNHMTQCDRCREIKEPARFRPGQVSWMKWCLRCERTPSGELPYPQTDADWDHAGGGDTK